MKKAGILIGAIFIILAIGVFGVSRVVENKSANKINKPIEVVETTDKDKEKPIIDIEIDNISEKEPVIEKPVVVPKIEVIVPITTSVKELSDDILTQEGKEYEEIVIISSKTLLLIDEAVGEKTGKSIAYVLNTKTDNNRTLKLYVTETVYKQYEVSSRLKVIYRVIKNDKGTEFTLIQKVTATD